MLDSKEMVLVADSESINLLPGLIENKVNCNHVIHAIDYHTGRNYRFFDDFEDRRNAEWMDDAEDDKDGTILDGLKFLNDCAVLIMHNGTGYDYLAFEKTMGFTGVWTRDYFSLAPEHLREEFPFSNMDTIVMSRVLNPERQLPKEAFMMNAGNVGKECGSRMPSSA